MKRECSWCGAGLGEKEPFDDTSVTHGICSDCMDNQWPYQDEDDDEEERREDEYWQWVDICADEARGT